MIINLMIQLFISVCGKKYKYYEVEEDKDIIFIITKGNNIFEVNRNYYYKTYKHIYIIYFLLNIQNLFSKVTLFVFLPFSFYYPLESFF